MVRNRLYYGIKPLLPWSVRMGIRRWFARRKLRAVAAVWPIQPGSEKPPDGWLGWPGKKQFAFILTHDVEGIEGLKKVRQLAELEMSLGFRSCFNFIPEGEYRVPRELRDWLVGNGFEVGVHDLKHDGRLFSNRQEFARCAPRINEQLAEWGAVGFRAGFMLHQLDWLHDLNIQYDCSTFDTDPFEPQPQGQRTIFPFWVPRPIANSDQAGSRDPKLAQTPNSPHSTFNERNGYVELPYTLPQDSTLFLLLREKSPNIWLRKMDWIARFGGMALINVHPDYLCLDGEPHHDREYPVRQYRNLLEYVAAKYADNFWHATPSELATWYRGAMCPVLMDSRMPDASSGERRMPVVSIHPKNPDLSGKRAAVVVYSYYDSDPRPRRETEALCRAGMEVDVICLRKNSSHAWQETVEGVNVWRVPIRHRRSSKLTYTTQYSSFLFVCFLFLSVRRLRRHYDLVHVHNMPDFLVFSAILPRLLGAKIILDLHDPMPELFQGIYGYPRSHFVVRWLERFEKWSIAFADLVLTPNIAFKEIFASRSSAPGKIRIITNSPQTEIFHSMNCTATSADPSLNRPFTIMYHGLLVERHGLDLAVHAVAQLRARIPNLQLNLYGDRTDYLDQVLQIVQELGLEGTVQYHGFKPLPEIAQAISTSALGLIPNRLNAFTRINLPTRIFEYLAMGKPVLAPRTRGIQDYFSDKDIIFFNPDDVDDLASKIEWVYAHPNGAAGIVQNGRKIYESHRWDLEEHRFLALVADLLGASPAPYTPPSSVPPPRRICMITHSNYDSDNRVIRYAEALAQRGDSVEVLALKSDRSKASIETIGRVCVRRIQCRSQKNQRSKAAYLLPLVQFWLRASACLSWSHLKKRYDVVHVHNIPDFLVFAAWLPRLTGTKVILDIHDIVPEFYASKFHLAPDSFGVRMLKLVERASARFANKVIISNHLWLDKFATRTGANGKCSVFINNVDSSVFHPRPRARADDRLIVMFPGGMQWHQGLDIAIRAFLKISPELPKAEFHIYGDGNVKADLMALSRKLGLDDKVRFFNPLPVRQIAEVMANADVGVVPKRADGFGNEAYSTKIMEFMSLGVPVVVSSTKIDRFYFNDSVVRFFESGNPDAMADAMAEVLRNAEKRQSLVSRGLDYAAQNSWDKHRPDYLKLVDNLCATK